MNSPPGSPEEQPGNTSYQRHRDRVGAAQRKQSEDARDLVEIPKVKNRRRRNRCERNLRLYLETYYPATFGLGWSDDHLEFISDVESALLNGGRKAVGMPRGSGKTSILTRAPNWALSYGHRRFLALIGAEEQAAADLAAVIKIEWETNELLLEDFPEIAYPIRQLGGITQRANAQHIGGQRTHITWTGSEIVFPTVPGSVASGATIRCAGILGRIRGMNVVDAGSGQSIRPDCFLIDDFQTDASARSESQCATRELLINGAIMGLAGPGKSIAGLASSTIIRHGDTAARLFNRLLYPRWRASVYKLVYEWPKSEEALKHWDRYLEIRAAELAEAIEEHPKANAYYRKHRKIMDAGSRVAWEARKLPHEISALQHAFGLRADNPQTFDAEYQNEPPDPTAHLSGLVVPTADQLVVKQDSHKRGTAPTGATRLLAGVDIQGSSLWWVMVAVDDDFTGWVVDRGVWPEQPGLGIYFGLSQLEQTGRTIAQVTGLKQPEAALRVALTTLTEDLFSRRVPVASGEVLRLERCLIDDGYLTRVVQAFCRSSDLAVMPCKGIGVTAKNIPWSRTRRKPGERRGPGWKMPPVMRTDEVRHVIIDTNDWATRLAHRWTSPIGTPGAWSLYKAPHALHRMLADQLTTDRPTETSGQGRTLYEWSTPPGADNHWGDALRMAAVAASIAGVAVPGEGKPRSTTPKPPAEKPRRRTMAERQAQAMAKRKAG